MIAGSLRGRVEEAFPVAPLTTYRLGGKAELYVEPAGAHDLVALGRALKEAGVAAGEIPILALGRGSNLVISDEGLPGIVLRMGPAFSWIEPRPEHPGLVAGASTPLPQVANWAARRGLSGLEWLVSIPGSVGGAVRMNAGAHGGETAGALVTATVFDLDELALVKRPPASLHFAYRRSSLTERDVVVEATFELDRDNVARIKARMENYRKHRAQTQPGALQNAGSVFKNPEGDSSGRLVEAAGLKGFSVGGASVSDLHANFFMAGPQASAQDVYDLVHTVRALVRDRFGVELEPEIRFAGRFRPAAGAEVADGG